MSHTIVCELCAETTKEKEGRLTGGRADSLSVCWSEGGVEIGIKERRLWINLETDVAKALAHAILIAARAAQRFNR